MPYSPNDRGDWHGAKWAVVNYDDGRIVAHFYQEREAQGYADWVQHFPLVPKEMFEGPNKVTQ